MEENRGRPSLRILFPIKETRGCLRGGFGRRRHREITKAVSNKNTNRRNQRVVVSLPYLLSGSLSVPFFLLGKMAINHLRDSNLRC